MQLFSGKGGYFEKLSWGSKTLDRTYEWLADRAVKATLQTCVPKKYLWVNVQHHKECAIGDTHPVFITNKYYVAKLTPAGLSIYVYVYVGGCEGVTWEG